MHHHFSRLTPCAFVYVCGMSAARFSADFVGCCICDLHPQMIPLCGSKCACPCSFKLTNMYLFKPSINGFSSILTAGGLVAQDLHRKDTYNFGVHVQRHVAYIGWNIMFIFFLLEARAPRCVACTVRTSASFCMLLLVARAACQEQQSPTACIGCGVSPQTRAARK